MSFPLAALAALALAPPAPAAVPSCGRGPSPYAAAVASTPGVVGYWRLGERSGVAACDETGRTPGKYSRGVALGRAGAISDGDRAAGFRGPGRLRVRAARALSRGSALSVEAWIKPAITRAGTVLRKRGQYVLRLSRGRLVARVRLGSGASVEVASSRVLRRGAFQHVALTYDRATLRVYRNGVLVAAKRARGRRARGRSALLIGAGFRGTLDELAVYGRALTAKRIFRRSAAPTPAAPLDTAGPPAPPPAPPPAAGTITGGGSCTGDLASFGAGSGPPGCWRPYAPTSPFNVPLPPSPRLLANSREIVQRILGWNQITPLWVGTADTPDDYGHPTYYARASDPLYTLRCSGRYCPMPIEGHRIHVPPGARPAGGSDGHMAIVQPDGVQYELYEVAAPVPAGGGTVYANGGGRTTIDGPGVGVANGATSAKFAVPAGVIRAQEMEAGEIRHALFIAVKCVNGTYVYPAAGAARPCSAIGEPDSDAPPNGARLQLALSDEEIDALGVPAWKRTILRAMARYGLYVGDTGGGFIHPESGSSYTSFGRRDPWEVFAERHLGEGGITTWVGSRDGKRDYALDIRSGVPWERLRVIDPCVTRATC